MTSEMETLRQFDESYSMSFTDDDNDVTSHNVASLSAASVAAGQQSSVTQHMYVN